MPKLVILLPNHGESSIELAEEIITVGRLEDNMLIIDDASMSGHHAQLKLEGGDYHLKDLNSTNGTRVNGQNISAQQLHDGDTVRFGKVEGVYHSEIHTTRSPMPAAGKVAQTTGASSSRPTDFSNAAPFKKRGKKKDPAGMAVIGYAALAMLVAVAAMLGILSLHGPQ